MSDHTEVWRRTRDGQARYTSAIVRETGSDVEPTGVVEVSIEAFREVMTELGWRPVCPVGDCIAWPDHRGDHVGADS